MSRRDEEGFAGAIRGTAGLEIRAPEPSPYSDLINVCLDLVRGNLDTYVRDADAERIKDALVAAGVPLPEEPEYEPSGGPAVTTLDVTRVLKQAYSPEAIAKHLGKVKP